MDTLWTIILTVVLVAAMMALGKSLDYISCASSADQNDVEYKWGIMAGCSYKHPTSGLWVPKENYRAVGD